MEKGTNPPAELISNKYYEIDDVPVRDMKESISNYFEEAPKDTFDGKVIVYHSDSETQ